MSAKIDLGDLAAYLAEAQPELQELYASYVPEAQVFVDYLTARAMGDVGVAGAWELAWLAICEAVCDVDVDDQTGIPREGEQANSWRKGYRTDLIAGLVGALIENAQAYGDPLPLIDDQEMTVICKTGGGVGLVIPEIDIEPLLRALGDYTDYLNARADTEAQAEVRALKCVGAAVCAAQRRLAERLAAEKKHKH